MEAGTLAPADDSSPLERVREWMGDHPGAVTGIVVAVIAIILIADEGLKRVADTGLTGLSTGSILALAAVGLTLVYGILKLVNFAHGDFLTFGAYMAYILCGISRPGCRSGSERSSRSSRPRRLASSSRRGCGARCAGAEPASSSCC